MAVTLKDIARETNLSVTTVSLVLNNKPNRVAESTRKLIRETASRLNYYPNQIAVGLAKQVTNTIGLIIPDISNYFFNQLALGIDDEINKSNRAIILSNTSDNCQRDFKSIQMFQARNVDAIILAVAADNTPETLNKYQDFIKESRIPIITIDRYVPFLNCSCIKVNNQKGAYYAISHLLSLGHTSIALITGPSHIRSTQERLDGCKWAFSEAGLEWDPSLVFEGNYLYSSGIRMSENILQNTKATAIFAFNDLMAYGVYYTLRQHGLKIPNDISVVGFDDIAFADMMEVPLTTVKQPIYTMGLEVAKRAILEIEHPDSPKQNINLEPEFILRSSTAAIK